MSAELSQLRRDRIAVALESTATPWGSSRFGEWRRCAHAHHLRYHLAVQPAPRRTSDEMIAAGDESEERMGAESLDSTGRPRWFGIGSLVHGGLRYWREGAMLGQLWSWRDVLEAAEAMGVDGETVDEAGRLLEVYAATYGHENGGMPEGSRILGVELPIEVPAGVLGPLPYTAAADCVLQLEEGEIVILDTKTRSRAFPWDRQGYARGAATRSQFLGLSWLVRRELNLDYAPAVWVDALIKTKLAKCDRLLVKLTPDALDRWAEAQTADAHALSAQVHAGSALRNYSSCAPEVGAPCWAFDWCHGSPEARARFFTIGAHCNG